MYYIRLSLPVWFYTGFIVINGGLWRCPQIECPKKSRASPVNARLQDPISAWNCGSKPCFYHACHSKSIYSQSQAFSFWISKKALGSQPS